MTSGLPDTHMPMTNPGAALAIHNTSYGHSTSWVERDDGSVLVLYGGGRFRMSADGGLTWSEEFQGSDEAGDPLTGGSALVRLSGQAIGLLGSRTPDAAVNNYDRELVFRRSCDEGHTWSEPTLINPRGPSSFVWQDMLRRTSSGRIIAPVYLCLGQGSFHMEGTGFVGGLVNGNFVSTDAHFVDPHFGASFVWYSDDEGETWQRNGDGELFVITRPGGPYEPTYEPSVTEVAPGHLMMIMRTNLGRYYQAWSHDDGASWTRPQATHLAGTHAPAQVRTLPNGHLLCVFTQQSAGEIRRGFIRTRLSSAISRTGGKLWEHFQNAESIHPEAHVPPGPIDNIRPEGYYSLGEGDAYQNDPQHVVDLPVGYGRWSYPSVLVLEDRVLIAHSYSYHDETGARHGPTEDTNAKLKVLPLSWFYGGREPCDLPDLQKLEQAANP